MKKNWQKLYSKRKYYRLDAIIESFKALIFHIFLKQPKLHTYRPLLYKMPPRSVIRYNLLGCTLFNAWCLFLHFTKIKKMPFIIEETESDKNAFFNQEKLTNPTPPMLKSPIENFKIKDDYLDNIEKSYTKSIADDHLKFENSIWWNECIGEIKSYLFDENNKLKIENLENIFSTQFKAYLFDLSSPIKKNNSKLKNIFLSLKIINHYHGLSSIIDDYVLRSISESEVGNNRCISYNGQRLSERLIRYGYYTSQILKNTNFLNSNEFIFLDLGSGFGGLSRLLLNFNKNSKCIIIEQPEICAFASYYMKLNFPKKNILNYEDYKNFEKKENFFKSKEFDVLILPNWCMEFIPDNFINLTISTTSLGEMTKQSSKYFLNNMERTTKDYFYSNNKISSEKEIWDGYGHDQFCFNKNWMTLIYNYSYTWHLELLAKKID